MHGQLPCDAVSRLCAQLVEEFDGVLPRRRVERVVARCAEDVRRVAESRFAGAAAPDLTGVLAETARHQLARLARDASRV